MKLEERVKRRELPWAYQQAGDQAGLLSPGSTTLCLSVLSNTCLYLVKGQASWRVRTRNARGKGKGVQGEEGAPPDSC